MCSALALSEPSIAPPTVVGASVIGVKYADGVMLATFTNVYGHRPIMQIDRIHTIGEKTLVTASGNHPDYQESLYVLNAKQQEDALWLRGEEKNAYEWRNMMQTQLYQKRNKIAPSWVTLLFAGFKDDAPYLGMVDYFGTAVDGDYFCPGMGQYFSIPDLRKHWRQDLTEQECRDLIMKCLTIMVRNIKQVTHQVQFAKITKTQRVIEEPITVKARWHDTFI